MVWRGYCRDSDNSYNLRELIHVRVVSVDAIRAAILNWWWCSNVSLESAICVQVIPLIGPIGASVLRRTRCGGALGYIDKEIAAFKNMLLSALCYPPR